MILFFGILQQLLIVFSKNAYWFWLTSDIVYVDSELALTVKTIFMQKNNTCRQNCISLLWILCKIFP